MKKIIFLFVSIITMVSANAQQINSVAVGTKAPLLQNKMLSTTQNNVSVQEAMKKNGVLVMFSCNTCPYVIKNETRIKVIAQYALANNVGVITINSNEALRADEDSYKNMQQYAKKQGFKWHYTVDNNSVLADAYGATRTPEVFLLNNDGTIVYKGAIDDNPSDASNVTREHLKIAIDEMLNNKTIAVTESKSVGCSIKRMK